MATIDMNTRLIRRNLGAATRAGLTVAMTAVLLLAGANLSCSESTEEEAKPSSPEETLRKGFLEQNGLAGRVVLMEFGQAGAPLTDKGLDEMIRLHKHKAVENLAYVRVDTSEVSSAVDEYYRTKAVPFLVHRDIKKELAKAFKATVCPTFVLVGKFGRIRSVGELPTEKTLTERAEMLLAESSDPGPDVPLLGVVKLDAPKLLAATRLPALNAPAKLLAEYMGKCGLLIVFADTSCPYAEIAVGDMPKVTKELARYGVASVVVNLDNELDDVKEYYAKHKTDTPVVYDTTANTQHRWNIRSVPTVVLIDADGKIGYNDKAVWSEVAVAGEKALGLAEGTIWFEEVQGTGDG